MKKILLSTLMAVSPINIGLINVNYLLKENNEIKFEWIKLNEILEQYSFVNKNKLFEDQTIEINLINNHSSEKIAKIYAKTPNKKYYLKLNNNQNYQTNEIKQFIKEKFYQDQTIERFISRDKFYSFLDTKDPYNGEITKNGLIQFRSSWGVFNGHSADSEVEFKWRERNLKDFVFLHDRENLPQGTRPSDIKIKTLKPKKIGLMPIVQIHQPPIRYATWKTKKIKTDNWDKYTKHFEIKQDLNLPEGHANGLEWWKGITSSIGPMLGIITGAAGVAAGIFLKSVFAAITAGALITAVSIIVDRLINLLNEISISDGIPALNNVYNLIMKKPMNINPDKMDFDNLRHSYISTFIEGEIWGNANATSIWGITSKMDMYGVWAAVNSDMSYIIYK